MSLPRSYFPECERMGLEVGAWVRFARRSRLINGNPDTMADYVVTKDGGETWQNYRTELEGEGAVELIWLCLDAEALRIRVPQDNGHSCLVNVFIGIDDLEKLDAR